MGKSVFDIDCTKLISALMRELEDMSTEDKLSILGYARYINHIRGERTGCGSKK